MIKMTQLVNEGKVFYLEYTSTVVTLGLSLWEDYGAAQACEEKSNEAIEWTRQQDLWGVAGETRPISFGKGWEETL